MLSAYHGDAELKHNVITALRESRHTGRLLRGSYCLDRNPFHGCALGVIVNTFSKIENRHYTFDSEAGDIVDHKLSLEKGTARVLEMLFERGNGDTDKIPEQLLAGIPVGYDSTGFVDFLHNAIRLDNRHIEYNPRQIVLDKVPTSNEATEADKPRHLDYQVKEVSLIHCDMNYISIFNRYTANRTNAVAVFLYDSLALRTSHGKRRLTSCVVNAFTDFYKRETMREKISFPGEMLSSIRNAGNVSLSGLRDLSDFTETTEAIAA